MYRRKAVAWLPAGVVAVVSIILIAVGRPQDASQLYSATPDRDASTAASSPGKGRDYGREVEDYLRSREVTPRSFKYPEIIYAPGSVTTPANADAIFEQVARVLFRSPGTIAIAQVAGATPMEARVRSLGVLRILARANVLPRQLDIGPDRVSPDGLVMITLQPRAAGTQSRSR